MKTEPSFPTCTPERPETWQLSRQIEILMREVAQLKTTVDILEHSPGRLAFLHRHMAMSYVRKHHHALYAEAMSYGYERVSADGCSYDDYVSRLEARVAEADAIIKEVIAAMGTRECPFCWDTQGHITACPVPRLVAWQALETTV